MPSLTWSWCLPFPCVMILVVPPPSGAAGGVVCGRWFFQIVFAQGLRPCREGSGRVSGAHRVGGLVGWWGCVRLFGSCPGGLGTEFIGIKKTCVFQFPVRDHLSEKVGQVFGVKLPCVEEGLGDALQIITVTG